MGLAFYNVLGAIGGFISPYIVGQLSNGGSYNSSMYVQGAFNLAAALMVLGESFTLTQPCMQVEWPPIQWSWVAVCAVAPCMRCSCCHCTYIAYTSAPPKLFLA